MTFAHPPGRRWYRSMLGPVTSDVPLPLCDGDPQGTGSWAVVVGDAAPVAARATGERPTIVRRERQVDLLFDGMARVTVDRPAKVVTVRPDPAVDELTLGSLVVDAVIPRVAADAHLVLHAAAVASADGKGATLVVGSSGTGKSTLAVEWSLGGWTLLGDDTVRVDGATAHPSWVGPRLWPGALSSIGLDERAGAPQRASSEKRRLGADDGIVLARRPAPVHRLVLLGASSPSRVSAVRLLSEQALNLGWFDPVRLLDQVTALVRAVREIEVRPPWPPAAL